MSLSLSLSELGFLGLNDFRIIFGILHRLVIHQSVNLINPNSDDDKYPVLSD